MKKVVVLLVLFLVFFGCIQSAPIKENQENNSVNTLTDGGIDLSETVESGDTIKVEYIGKFPDTGEVFDKSEGRGPLEFTVGAGQMIKGFDAGVLGMKLNEEKTVTIPPEDAYGTLDSGQKIEVPVASIGGEVSVGSKVTANTGQEGTVIEIKDGTAVVEFIHPLAGKTLEFWIKVIELNKA